MTHINGPEQLTPREQEIALLIGRGLRNAEIGEALGISEQTVKNHVRHSLGKLAMRTRAALAVHVDRRKGGWKW
jgi:DNA-binding NarL/FixJ family response regulator